MEFPCKCLDPIVFKTRAKIEEHMFTVMDKSTYEEHVSQPSDIKNIHFQIAVITGF